MLTLEQIAEIRNMQKFRPLVSGAPNSEEIRQALIDRNLALSALLADRAELAGELREIAEQGIALGLAGRWWMAQQLSAIAARLEGE